MLHLPCDGNNRVLLLREAGRAGLLAWAAPPSPFCATIKITLGYMQLYAVLIDFVPSTQKRFSSWLTPALHQYFWPHMDWFQWQKWLSQLFPPAPSSHCQSLTAHPSSHDSLSRAHANIYLATQWTRSGNWSGLKTQKYKTCWLISYPDQFPGELTVQHTAQERLCWIRARVHLVWCPAPGAEQTQQMLSKEGC